MELYARVRRAVQVEGLSERGAAREFGISRETVRKMLRYSIPPGYSRQQPVKRPKLGAWIGVIDQILEEDKGRPANNGTAPSGSSSGCGKSMRFRVATRSSKSTCGSGD